MSKRRNSRAWAAYLAFVMFMQQSCWLSGFAQPTDLHRVSRSAIIASSANQMAGADAGEKDRPPLIELSELPAKKETQAAQTTPQTALKIDRLRQLAELLPKLPAHEITTFKFQPVGTTPPPKGVKEITLAFPAPENTPVPHVGAAEPLRVVHISHRGEVMKIPNLVVSFSQPMVSLTDLDSSAVVKCPVRLEPQPAGAWHWMTDKTIEFDPAAKMFPRATTYRVEVPAGTKSLLGGRLEQPWQCGIITPAPHVESFTQDVDQTGLAPLLIAKFDQPFKSEQVMEHVHARCNGLALALRLASKEEIKDFVQRSGLQSADGEDTRLYFQAVEKLSPNSEIEIAFEPGIASSEGPNCSEFLQKFSFHTYEPLCIEAGQSGLSSTQAVLAFNNELAHNSESSVRVSISPHPTKLQPLLVQGNELLIRGLFDSKTTYRFTVDGGVTDIFGQQLLDKKTILLKIRRADPCLLDNTGLRVQLRTTHPSYNLSTLNIASARVRIYAVEENDWDAFGKEWIHVVRREKELPDVCTTAKLIEDRQLKIGSRLNEWSVTQLNLAPCLAHGHRQVILFVETGSSQNYFCKWINISDLSVQMFTDRQKSFAYVTDLRTGLPLSGATIRTLTNTRLGTTDETGLASLQQCEDKPLNFICEYAGDRLLTDQVIIHNDNGIGTCHWYAVVDRYTYLPSESVTVKGWVRLRRYDAQRSLIAPGKYVQSVSYLVGTASKPLAQGNANVDEDGGFSFTFAIPITAPLGYQTINISAKSDSQLGGVSQIENAVTSTQFQISEFRRPEFEVELNQDKKSIVLGESATVSIATHYRSGGALPRAKVSWTATTQPTQYIPTGWPGYTFGRNVFQRRSRWSLNDTKTSKSGVTDGSGTDAVELKCARLNEIEPVSVSTQVTVQDLSRQEWSQSTYMLVHPAAMYAGIKIDNEPPTNRQSSKSKRDQTPAAHKGRLTASIVAVDIDGKVSSGKRMQVVVRRRDVSNSDGEVHDVYTPISTVDCKSSDDPTPILQENLEPGTYEILADVWDTQGRRNETSLESIVVDRQSASIVPQPAITRTLTMSCDHDSYKVGDEAHVSIESSVPSGRGILIVSNCGVLKTVPITIEGGAARFDLPITEACVSSVELFLTIPIPNDQPLAAATTLNVPPTQHALKLHMTPADAVTEPRATTSFDLKVTAADGTPAANAQVAVAVVDENILALSGFRWSDPLAGFYEESGRLEKSLESSQTLLPTLSVQEQLKQLRDRSMIGGQLAALSSVDRYTFYSGRNRSRDTNMFQVEPTRIDERHYTSGRVDRSARGHFTTIPMRGYSATIPGAPQAKPSFSLRSNLNPLAYFNPNVRTDSNGQAHVEFKLPDNVTRYRIMAVAATRGGDFGAAESEFSTRLALTLRPTPPRFLHEGDRCEIPIILQNETDQPMSTDVIVRAENLDMQSSQLQSVITSDLAPIAGAHIDVPPKDRVEVHFQSSSRKAGTATLQIAAVAGDRHDATETTLPVTSPLEDESFAAYGEIDQDKAEQQQISLPATIAGDIGGFEAQLSSTAMTELEDSARYLQNYPYECSEQISSRILALVGLRRLANLFPSANLIDTTAADTRIKEDLRKLCQRQRDNNGDFGLWSKDDSGSYPYVSIQAARALQMSSDAGYYVSPDALFACNRYLGNVQYQQFPTYSQRELYAIRAYALSVLHSQKSSSGGSARQLLNSVRLQYDDAHRQADISFCETPADPLGYQAETGEHYIHSVLRESLSLESMCWLLPLISDDPDEKNEADAMREIISEHIFESASTAEIQDDSYESHGFLLFYSNTRLHAVVLEALIQDQPSSPLIPKLLRGLLLARKNGIWANTQDNGYALVALSKYFSTYEKAEPDFVADLWLGSTQAAHQRFSGRAIASDTIAIPMQYLLTHKEDRSILLRKAGSGRLYYRLGLKYAYSNPYVQKRSHGIEVDRQFEAIDDPHDVVQLSDGTWQVRSGATFRVHIKFTAPATRHYVAMTDPTAGGLELLNTELRGTRSIDHPDLGTRFDRQRWPATFDHVENRDQGLRAFADTLRPGQYEYIYPVRATSPGTYVIPACKMEEMYSPETFGHSSACKMIIVSDQRNH
jgi:uncharacterized protein YfaS (alpha-2-macroglobulin family)